MSPLACPHCGRRAISPFRKLLLGPGGSANCAVCQHRIGVPVMPTILGPFTFFGAVAYARTGERPMLESMGTIVGAFLIWMLLAWRFVPVVER
jgi:hypothetical protein